MKPLKIAGFACVGVCGALFLLWKGCGPIQPSDLSLEIRFHRQRADLERLVAMMEVDFNMSRIADDFTWRQDSVAWPRPESEWGISRKRWDEYREVFARAGFELGTSRDEGSDDTEIHVWGWGIVPAERTVSYLHCGRAPFGYSQREPACIEKKQAGRGMYAGSETDGYRYKRLAEDWYILEQWN